jgi:glutamate synthase (NADPH/NADH) small chain
MENPTPEDRGQASFQDFKPAYTQSQAVAEAHRCLFCADAPCVTSCPTHIEIPQFIRKITTGNIRGSARTIFEANILGMSCARVCPVEVLCVGACVYNHMGQPPIQIGRLQRYSTDVAFAEGWRFFEAGPTTGKSVGLVGSGPASLACAHELRRRGHACTIYERRSVVGGLNTTGVAPYKMKSERAIEEARWILQIGGIDVQTGVSVGTDLSWPEIESRHDALFLGFGLGPDRTLELPGESLERVIGAVEFIEQMKLSRADLRGVNRAVVLGGGNTAVDGVRALLGLGVPEVTLVYRGTEEGMPGYDHEWKAAKVEGARVRYRAVPIAYEGTVRVERVRCLRTDERKRPIPGTEFEIEADLVLLALGQGTLGKLVAQLPGIVVEDGCVIHDGSGATGRPGVFAGGDGANGGKEVVNATAEGKTAAEAIDRWLRGVS